jgi:hypothetical protein
MAKARKAAAKTKRSKRRPKTKSKARKSKKQSIRKRRPKTQPGIADKLARAIQVVTDSIEETSRMRRKAGLRGGIGEG